ncbi:hypothetical protein [Phytomonospora endophytica]|uniref:Putative sterol carrier protein n=1 Tax=Phytomonospora endophytica TaxID=714109 RepID=A0A841FNW8_9ACTN|nr:hypothetical protein [Phytomonospora endophytica]MBB6035252.1 putative sterol carrier protein [Phytomonospora endophytica]GIG64000.1 hypothetical protein Pen01_02950 [Phytomonospora endophytica]
MTSDSTSEVVFRDSRDKIVERAKAAGVPYKARSYRDPHNTSRVRQMLEISIPSGREQAAIFVSERAADLLAEANFEDWVALGDYNAVLDKKMNVIEAMISGPAVFLKRAIERLALRQTKVATADEEYASSVVEILEGETSGSVPDWSLPVTVASNTLTVTISPATIRMCIDVFWRPDSAGPRDRRGVSLKIAGVSTSRHDEALEILEQYSRSIFFEIDLLAGLTLILSRRPARDAHGIEFGMQPEGVLKLGQVTNKYASEAVTLYSYGRSAQGMPLLEFLAYYQAIEFFFPSFVNADIHKRVRIKLRDPRFDVESDSDIQKVVAAASGASQGGQPKEREQLRIALEACLEDAEIKDFITNILDSKDFFSAKCNIRGTQALRFEEKGSGSFVRQVADRIYAIRCRIVHSKESPDNDTQPALLPYGSEAQELVRDIALARFVAQKVIIAGSRGRL